MTIIDQVRAVGRGITQPLVDKEPVNYIEAGALFTIIATCRYHLAMLSVMHNHARDPELRALIKEALDSLTEAAMTKGEDLLRAGGASVPTVTYPIVPLQESLEIPDGARLTDPIIAMALVNMDGASQMALLGAMHQCYQPEIALMLGTQLRRALDWSFRLMQLMLERGWLPQMAKVTQ
jgi:spore coat protein CotF